MTRIYSKHAAEMVFATYFPSNQKGDTYESEITSLRAEKKTLDTVLVSWENKPHNAMAPFTIYRALFAGDSFEYLANGMGTMYVDAIDEVSDNEFIRYRVECLGDVKETQLYVQADNYLLGLAGEYLWQLRTTSASNRAVAYCSGKTTDYCPECYSETLKKRTKSSCSMCNGSGRIMAFTGPVHLYYAPLQQKRDQENIGNVEREMEIVAAWTGNTPILSIGDIIINSHHVKYIVQAIPERVRMHSLISNDEFIVRQHITLRRINPDEYPDLIYVPEIT